MIPKLVTVMIYQLYEQLLQHTVCPGSSDPPEKIFNIFSSAKMRFTPFINYYNTLG